MNEGECPSSAALTADGGGGTGDDVVRAVCAPPLRKAPCAAATAAWGVANVYC